MKANLKLAPGTGDDDNWDSPLPPHIRRTEPLAQVLRAQPETAAQIASHAANLIGGDREVTHGNKQTNFNNIAALWTAWLRINHNLSRPLRGSDVAKMMVLLKIARMETGTLNVDDALDACGYAAIAGELAALE